MSRVAAHTALSAARCWACGSGLGNAGRSRYSTPGCLTGQCVFAGLHFSQAMQLALTAMMKSYLQGSATVLRGRSSGESLGAYRVHLQPQWHVPKQALLSSVNDNARSKSFTPEEATTAWPRQRPTRACAGKTHACAQPQHQQPIIAKSS